MNDTSAGSPRPRAFIASSTESQDSARAAHTVLSRDGFEPIMWTLAFEPGAGYLEDLLRWADEVDFAVLILGSDDLTTSLEGGRRGPPQTFLRGGSAKTASRQARCFLRVGGGRSPPSEGYARLARRDASIAPSSQMLCLRVSGITKMAIRNMINGTPMG